MGDPDKEQSFETVGNLAQLYLGNILYAIELAALSLDEQNRHVDASFYRGIARKLAEAHGRSKQQEIENGHSNNA